MVSTEVCDDEYGTRRAVKRSKRDSQIFEHHQLSSADVRQVMKDTRRKEERLHIGWWDPEALSRRMFLFHMVESVFPYGDECDMFAARKESQELGP